MTLHRVRPSNCGRTILCPGWAPLANAHALPDLDDEDAREGTRLHRLIHDELMIPETAPLEEEDRHLVERAAEFYKRRTEGAKAIFHEKALQFYLDGGEPLFVEDGTADVVAVFEDGHAVIIDWKTGWQPYEDGRGVTAQGMAYAVCAWQQFGISKHIDFFVYQPRFGRSYYVEFAQEELPHALARIRGSIETSAAPSYWKYLNPSTIACETCPAKAVCPAVSSLVPVERTAHEVVNSKLEQWLSLWPILERMNREVRAEAKRRIEAGTLPGFKLTERNGRREVTDIAALAKAVAHLATPQEILANCTVRVTAMIDHLKRANAALEGGTLKDSERTVLDLIAPYVERAAPSQVIEKDDTQ